MSSQLKELILSDPVHWCRVYRNWGLGVTVEPEHQRIIMEVNDFGGAITMPDVVGSKVRAVLERDGNESPVVAHPRTRSWTIITGTHDDSELDMDIYAALFRVFARITPRGCAVALPSPADIDMHYREWIAEPGPDIPPMRTVVAAILTVARTQGPSCVSPAMGGALS
jgi:hypothetical protein